VFGASWQLVGRSGAVGAPGQYFTGGLAPYRYLVARGDDGVLRAFHNVRARATRAHVLGFTRACA
jgi:choline monooxygenase